MWLSVNSCWLRLHSKCMIFVDLTIIECIYLILFVKFVRGENLMVIIHNE